MNINSGQAKLVLLCPACRKWGTARTVKPGTLILHSWADDVVPFAASEELARTSGATLIEVGTDQRLADPEPLAAMRKACEGNLPRCRNCFLTPDPLHQLQKLLFRSGERRCESRTSGRSTSPAGRCGIGWRSSREASRTTTS